MGNEVQESFEEFYTKWIGEQRQQLGQLLLAAKSSPAPAPALAALVARTVAHYEEYYTTKSKCAEREVLILLSPPWTSQLEDAFIWVGGWRPTTAFHLLYSKSGLQLTARLSGGAAALDLSELSAEQMALIDALQRTTVAEERRVSEKVAKQQERVADPEMVELSHDASTRIEEEEDEDEDDIGKRIEKAVRVKEEGFQKVLKSADDLRLGTLKGVVGILSPIQAVHFLIAAGELHLSLHQWGRDKQA